MQSLLFLSHRVPYPPNKGDKLRSYHLLRFLAQRYRVFLGTFVDDPADWQHVETLRELCADVHVASLDPRIARLRSLQGLLTGEALTLPYYRNAALASWVDKTIAEQQIDRTVVFSSAMAQYVQGRRGLLRIVDFVDVDSAKWGQYAPSRPWPLSTIYRRESQRLLQFERTVAQDADVSVFVTAAEANLFHQLAPDCNARVVAIANGVDTSYFDPSGTFESPFAAGEAPLVFTGAMDYWPNIDAVAWFATDILPQVRRSWPAAVFYIVGMRPAPAVQALAKAGEVVVTGSVPDVRPYLRHARMVVAPLRVARGIQNKVLEAMAMEKAVVLSAAPATGLTATPGEAYEVAADADEFAQKVLRLADERRAESMGHVARAHVLAEYGWNANLAPIDAFLRREQPETMAGSNSIAARASANITG